MKEYLFICLCLAVFAFSPMPVVAETSIGISQPFYIDTDLAGGDVGGYGFRFEYSRDRWFVAYDRLQNVKRRQGGIVNNQDFVTAGYRYSFDNHLQLSAGIAVNETSDVLGSAASFNLGVGYEFKRVRVTWRHWSNANTNHVNHGFDALTISWRLHR